MSWAPFYQPSGEYIVYASNAQGMANLELYMVDVEGRREPVRVTFTEGFDGLPVFLPDGRRIAWASKRTPDRRAQIFIADCLDAVFAAIRRVGALLGVAGRGEAEAAALRRRADRARATGRGEGPGEPRVLFAVSTSPVIAAGAGTFMDELVRLSGGRNVAAGMAGRYPRLSVEDLVALRPDVVFVAGMAGVETFPEEVTRWKEVPAFRDGAVVTLDGDIVTRPGPRLVAALEQVSGAIAAWREGRAKALPPGRGGKP